MVQERLCGLHEPDYWYRPKLKNVFPADIAAAVVHPEGVQRGKGIVDQIEVIVAEILDARVFVAHAIDRTTATLLISSKHAPVNPEQKITPISPATCRERSGAKRQCAGRDRKTHVAGCRHRSKLPHYFAKACALLAAAGGVLRCWECRVTPRYRDRARARNPSFRIRMSGTRSAGGRCRGSRSPGRSEPVGLEYTIVVMACVITQRHGACHAAIWYSCVSPPRICFRRIWCSARLIGSGG